MTTIKGRPYTRTVHPWGFLQLVVTCLTRICSDERHGRQRCHSNRHIIAILLISRPAAICCSRRQPRPKLGVCRPSTVAIRKYLTRSLTSSAGRSEVPYHMQEDECLEYDFRMVRSGSWFEARGRSDHNDAGEEWCGRASAMIPTRTR
nr:hypothetical protein CFP56_67364 [Quercus suber]